MAYATGEIILIFVGITLALWFNNWNEQRLLLKTERAAIQEIASNLASNLSTLEANIVEDKSSLADCQEIVDLLRARNPWKEDYAPVLGKCRKWTSPFLQHAAYESLRLRGTDLISNVDVRQSVISLYENQYRFLIEDIDHGQWVYEVAVWAPIFTRYVEQRTREDLRPSDYVALAQSTEFMNALVRHMNLMERSIDIQENTVEKTRRTFELVEAEIARLSSM